MLRWNYYPAVWRTTNHLFPDHNASQCLFWINLWRLFKYETHNGRVFVPKNKIKQAPRAQSCHIEIRAWSRRALALLFYYIAGAGDSWDNFIQNTKQLTPKSDYLGQNTFLCAWACLVWIQWPQGNLKIAHNHRLCGCWHLFTGFYMSFLDVMPFNWLDAASAGNKKPFTWRHAFPPLTK